MEHDDSGPTFHVEPHGQGVRIILPRRPATAGGIAAIIFGLFFAGFAAVWILGVVGALDSLIETLFDEPRSSPAQVEEIESGPETPEPLETPATTPEPLETPAPSKPKPVIPPQFDFPHHEHSSRQQEEGFDFMRIFMALFGVPFLLIGLGVIFTGILMLIGHSEVELNEQAITTILRAGPLRRTQSRIAGDLTHLEIGRAASLVSNSNEGSPHRRAGTGYIYNAIHAHFKSEQPLAIASGYPLSMLRSLALTLAQEHARLLDGRPVEISEPHHEEETSAANQPYTPEIVPPQPLGSRAVLDQLGSGISLRVPPVGFTKSTMPLMLFSMFWLGFVSLFTLMMYFIGVPLAMYLFISIFWGVGILVLLLGLNMMRKQAVIDVVHDTLLITQQSIFGRSQHEWRADELIDIRADHSGTSVNNRPLLNLQFIPREGKVVSLFTGREDDELHWMAASLRTAMHMRKQD